MRVLVVSHNFFPETFRINEVVRSLQLEGCKVTVLTGQPNYPVGKIFAGYSVWGLGVEERDGYRIIRVPIIPRGAGTAVRLSLNYLSFLFSACVLGPWQLRGQQFDVIFVYAPTPVIHSLAALLFRWLKRAPVVLWVQDLWPESLEATGFVRNRYLLGAVERVIRFIYGASDLILVQSRAFVERVSGMAGMTKVEYHPNPAELAFSGDSTLSPLVLKPGFNVVFAGNHGSAQALDTILEAAELLRGTAAIRIVLVGDGSKSDWLRQEIQRRNLSNVDLPGRFPPQAMPAILAQAEALLVSLVRSPIMALTVPSKIPAYFAAGKPIVASLDGEGASLVESSGAGLACPAENAAALAQAILELYRAPVSVRDQMGRAAITCYKSEFEPKTLTKRLMAHFASLARSATDTGKPSNPH